MHTSGIDGIGNCIGELEKYAGGLSLNIPLIVFRSSADLVLPYE